MPSPFPGMDPYLEGSLWPSVHTQLSLEIARQLAPRLRPRYVVRTPKRYVMTGVDPEEEVVVSTADLYPDVAVAKSSSTQENRVASSAAPATAPLHIATVMPQAVPQVTIEIRDVSQHQLVTAIEVLSPTNKRGEGRREYLIRRNRFLISSVHLMEIDLLRTGDRVPMRQPLPDEPYFVFLSRSDQRPDTEVWPIALDSKLPTVPIPLLPGDTDVMLDLQLAFTSIYDLFSYDLDINYALPPEIPLGPEEWQWVQSRIRKQMRGDE